MPRQRQQGKLLQAWYDNEKKNGRPTKKLVKLLNAKSQEYKDKDFSAPESIADEEEEEEGEEEQGEQEQQEEPEEPKESGESEESEESGKPGD